MEWSEHALQRMILREISKKAVVDVIMKGEIIEEYLDDSPYPSCLFLGKVQEFPMRKISRK